MLFIEEKRVMRIYPLVSTGAVSSDSFQNERKERDIQNEKNPCDMVASS
jgi:hypothetical protein